MKYVVAAAALVSISLLAVHFYLNHDERDELKLVRSQVEGIAAKVEVFALDTGSLPDSLSELTEPQGPAGYTGPYARKSELLDPWGYPLLYARSEPSPGFKVSSLGSDGKIGGRGHAGDVKAER